MRAAHLPCTVSQGSDLGEVGFGRVLLWEGDVGRSPPARGSRRLQTFVSVLTVLLVRPQILPLEHPGEMGND